MGFSTRKVQHSYCSMAGEGLEKLVQEFICETNEKRGGAAGEADEGGIWESD